jgi:O-antigen/teichoic acid export membrane protein
MFKDKNSLPRVILFLLGNNAISSALTLASSILVIRNIDKSEYGLYVVVMSIFAILEIFMGGYNQSISRYLKENISLSDKQNIVSYVLYYKYILLIIFLVLLFVVKDQGLLKYLLNEYSSVKDVINDFLVVAVLGSIITTSISVLNTLLIALYDYKFTYKVILLKNLTYLIIVSGMIFYTDVYLVYLYIGLLLNVIVLITLSVNIKNKYQEYSFYKLIKKVPSLTIYKKYFFSYATPLTTVSILTYFKNHVPIIILGKEFELADVTIFAILKNIFKMMHSVTGSFTGSLISRFIELKDNVKKFNIAINGIFYATFLMRLVIYISMIFTAEYLFIAYKIDSSEINNTLLYILGLEFLVAGIMTNYGLLLNLKTSTKNILYISIVRFIIELTLIYLLLISYGILGAGLVLLLSRYSETVMAYFINKKDNIIKYDPLLLVLISPFVIYSSMRVLI